MRTVRTGALVWAALVGGLSLAAVAAEPPPGAGWIPLFNGKDLSGWKVPVGDGGHWKAIDGVIDYDARSEAKGEKNLWTDKAYGDFTLRIDWRFKEVHGLYPMQDILPDGNPKKDADGKVIVTPRPNADSGIMLRGYPKAQINLWCWPVGSGEVWGYRTDQKMPPEVRAAAVPKVCADKPVGQWNTFEMTVRGETLNLTLNGKSVIENMQLPGLPKEGPIGLQHHGGFDVKKNAYSPASSLVQFRNIFLTPL